MTPGVETVFTVLAAIFVLFIVSAAGGFVGALLAQEPVRRRVKTRMPGGAKTGIILETDEEIYAREAKDKELAYTGEENL